jgi:hypothetical protein
MQCLPALTMLISIKSTNAVPSANSHNQPPSGGTQHRYSNCRMSKLGAGMSSLLQGHIATSSCPLLRAVPFKQAHMLHSMWTSSPPLLGQLCEDVMCCRAAGPVIRKPCPPAMFVASCKSFSMLPD